MNRTNVALWINRLAVALLSALLCSAAVTAQVGQGLLDFNTATEEQLAALPHFSADVAQAVQEARPFDSITDLHAKLMENGLTADQASEVYGQAFLHINLNTGTREEILLIPGVAGRMAHEFEEYRPWKAWSQFDREIGKYVGQEETDRLKRYVFIPLNLNTATSEEFQTIPGVGRRMAHEFEEYRPWKSRQQFQREIGKYVDEKEVARLWRYVVIE
ncbi:MAG TPA: helix-hairpin-helix domain-containing protein [Acidobacteriota bacterium]|nr:helix-hairpin-helix domain-containing protein [Acidobacteriota bacterium]